MQVGQEFACNSCRLIMHGCMQIGGGLSCVMVLCCAVLRSLLCCAAVCQIVLLSSLKTFVVAGNKFSGTVNENIYYLPALAKLDLSNNSLVGTTPPAIGCVGCQLGMHVPLLSCGAQAAACMPVAGLSRAGRALAQALAVCSQQSQQDVAGSIMTSTAWLLRQHGL